MPNDRNDEVDNREDVNWRPIGFWTYNGGLCLMLEDDTGSLSVTNVDHRCRKEMPRHEESLDRTMDSVSLTATR